MKKQSTKQTVLDYLDTRKTPPTRAQIAKGTKINDNTLRRLLPQMDREGLISWG